MKESHVNVVVLQEKIKFRNIKKHQKLKEEKNKLKRNLTDEELDVFFRTNYTFQNYPKGILITSY